MISKLVLATRNAHKVKEIQKLLSELQIQVFCLNDFPDIPEVVEDGETFEANALKKAQAIFNATQLPSLADDSGLEVDYLDGRPGVYSARFAGENATDQQNNSKLLELLQDVPESNRTGRFRCVMALVDQNRMEIVSGSCKGKILNQQRGANGFGYDPLFYVPHLQKTFAELELDEKNKLSHRGIALSKAIEILKKW